MVRPERSEPAAPRGAPVGAQPAPLGRLEHAVSRLESLVKRGSGRIGHRVETELLAITGAVAAGRIDDAVTRAERLAERLEHPSSRAVR